MVQINYYNYLTVDGWYSFKFFEVQSSVRRATSLIHIATSHEFTRNANV